MLRRWVPRAGAVAALGIAAPAVPAPPARRAVTAVPVVARRWLGHRPGQFQVGDWKCKTCNSHNFARNTRCYSCGATMPLDPQSRAQRIGGKLSLGDIKPTGGKPTVASTMAAIAGVDWWCPRCRCRNKDAAGACFNCRLPKPPGRTQHRP